MRTSILPSLSARPARHFVPSVAALLSLLLTTPALAECHPLKTPIKEGDTFCDCGACPEMIVVPGGTFTIGSPADKRSRDSDEGPQHTVTITRFAVGRYEVTFAEWDACHKARRCTRRPWDEDWDDRDIRPVINISWNDAKQYVAWLSEETGETYRLLTESEWEYAARAGTTTAYHWGETAGTGNANCAGCGGTWHEANQTAPVGSFNLNAFGLHDMAGNVSEWVEDCWREDYVETPTDGSARQGEDDGSCDGRRALRGGSWGHAPEDVRSAARSGDIQGIRDIHYGFRVARTLP